MIRSRGGGKRSRKVVTDKPPHGGSGQSNVVLSRDQFVIKLTPNTG